MLEGPKRGFVVVDVQYDTKIVQGNKKCAIEQKMCKEKMFP